eukprot:SAG31_NODE_18722_length_625_cov_0.963878_1_plen_53_part_10
MLRNINMEISWAGAEDFWAAWRRGVKRSDGGAAAVAKPKEALSAAGPRFQPCS